MNNFKFKNGVKFPLSEEELAKIAESQAEQDANRLTMLAENIRQERNDKLAMTDWMALRAMETGIEAIALNVYREALRDISEQPGFPENIVWPELR